MLATSSSSPYGSTIDARSGYSDAAGVWPMLPPSLDVDDPAAEDVRDGADVTVHALEAALRRELQVNVPEFG